MAAHRLCVAVLLLAFAGRGFGQFFCSDMTDCSTTITQTADVETCCLRSDSIAYATGPSAEGCVSCYVYGWVQNVSPDLTSAEPQVDTMAAEGEEVILTLYFTKNDPVNGNLLIFNIAPSGSAALNEDYTVDPMTEIRLRSDPIAITVTLLRDGVVGEGQQDIILTLIQDSRTQPNDNQLLIYDTIRIVLKDNDIQTGFGEMSLTVSESSNVQMACLETVGTPADSIIINVTAIPGTAGTDDFDLITSQLLISSTTLTPCVSFQALADDLGLEGDETLTLSLSGPENVLFGQDTLEITILDIDEIEFGFSEEDFAGDESAGVINVIISKTASTAREVSLTVTPTEYSDSFGPNPTFNPNSPNIATPVDDYVIDPVTVIVPPGDGGNILVQIPIIDDVIAEETEQVFVGVLSFAGDSNGATLGRNATKLIITDDDEETIRFEILINTVKESDQDFNYSLAIVKSISSEQTYSVGLRGTSVSAEPEDYFVPTTPYIFTPDQQTLNVTVTIRGDERIELEEIFEVTLRSVGDVGFLVNLTTRTTTVLIEDDDGNYTYVPEIGMIDINEGETLPVRFVLLNPPPDGTFEFQYNITFETQDGTATVGEDYLPVSDASVLGSDPPDGTVATSVTTLEDSVVEFRENFFVSARVVETGLPVVVNGSADISIVSDDVVLLTFEQQRYAVEECDMVEVCLANVTEMLEAVITVSLTTVMDGTAVEGVDYSADVEPLVSFGNGGVLGSGIVSDTPCITVKALPDRERDPGETFSVLGEVVSNADMATFVGANPVPITIIDRTVLVGFERAEYQAVETFVELCFNTSDIIPKPFTVNLTTSDITAIDGLDYIGVSRLFTLTNDTPFGCVVIDILLDDLVEMEESFLAEISSADPFVEFVVPAATVVIAQELAVIGFEQVMYMTNEGDSAVDVCVTVRNGFTDDSLAVSIAVLPDTTATEGEDYELNSPVIITIPALSNRDCLRISILPSAVVEGEEEILLNITGSIPDANVQIEYQKTTVVIAADGVVLIGFDPTEYNVSEGDVAQLVVVKSGQFDSDIDIRLTSGGVFDEVYTFPASGPASDSITVPFPISDDSTALQPGALISVLLALLEDDPQVMVVRPVATVIVRDDDGPVVVGFPEADLTVGEDAGTISVPVTVAQNFAGTVTVNFAVISGTAMEGPLEDYVRVGQSSLVFNTNGTQNIIVSIVNDDILEMTESFSISLSNLNPGPPLVEFGNSEIIITILDNEIQVTIGFDSPDYMVVEGNSVEIVIEKSGTIDSEISYFVSGFDGGRVGGFPAGSVSSTSSVTFNTSDDIIALEPPEVFLLMLSFFEILNPLVTISNPSADLIIRDDDGPVVVGFRGESDITVGEDAGTIMIPVTLSQLIAQTVTVDYSIRGITAVEGDDFIVTGSTTLTFVAPSTQYIAIAIVDDPIPEGTESLSVSLSNPQPAGVVLNQNSLTINIVDNDERGNITVFVNNTIIGDPFYTAPIDIDGPDVGFPPFTVISLCYEFHGAPDQTFSIVNDYCTLVNAHYTKPLPNVDINVIDDVYVRAVDSTGRCRNISVSLDQCSVTVDGMPVESNYMSGDITVKRYVNRGRVRVSVPNCDKSMFVMYVFCENTPLPMSGETPVDMMKFVIARGISISEKAHGLLGQMWNVPFEVTEYTGELGNLPAEDPKYYVTVDNTLPGSSASRSFISVLQERSWDRTPGPCLYAGNRQAGPTGDVSVNQLPNDSVIEGEYTDYAVSSDYGSDCLFCGQFDDTRCGEGPV